MADRPLHALVHLLRKALAQQGTGGLDDAELLERFVRDRDETAFEVLVWRHGTMVLNVCTRVLRDAQEAEDAFQATFLVLARKAASVGKAASLAGWLYRVAYRVALRARTRSARGGSHVPLPDDVAAPATADAIVWRDLGPVLDEEVNRLPEKYRVPFVLCYLEGHTNEEAARQLGCPRGTILSRLSRGREWLRTRLTRRGLTLAAGGLATALAADAGAAVPAVLIGTTVGAATAFVAGKAAGVVPTHVLALTEGVLHAMNLTRIKWIGTAALAVLLTTTGAALFAQREGERKPAAPAAAVAAGRGERGEAGRDGGDVRGMVRSVDAAQSTLTLAGTSSRDGTSLPEKMYTVAKDAEVLIDEGRGHRAAGREGKLADLAPGTTVVLRLGADKQTVEAILAQGPSVTGKLSAVDVAQSTVTLAGHSGGARRGGEEVPLEADKTYTIGKTAEVVIDDGRGRLTSFHEAKLTDLSVGCQVTLKLAPDQKEAVSILAEGSAVQGMVKAVDAGKRSITLGSAAAGRGGEAVPDTTYTVGPGADVLVEDTRPRRFFPVRAAKLEDVPVGAIVYLKLSPSMTTAVLVRAEGPSVSGALKSVDPNKGTLSIVIGARRGSDGEEKSYTVAKDARVMIDGTESKLGDLKVGETPTPVTLKLSLDQKGVQSITVNAAPRGR